MLTRIRPAGTGMRARGSQACVRGRIKATRTYLDDAPQTISERRAGERHEPLAASEIERECRKTLVDPLLIDAGDVAPEKWRAPRGRLETIYPAFETLPLRWPMIAPCVRHEAISIPQLHEPRPFAESVSLCDMCRRTREWITWARLPPPLVMRLQASQSASHIPARRQPLPLGC